MNTLISKYKEKKDLYNFIAVLTLILLGMLIITIFFFDFLLISFYLLYIAEIFSIVYLIKNQHNTLNEKDNKTLIKERNLFVILILLFIGVIYLLNLTNLSYALIFVFVLYLMNLITQLYLIKKSIKK